MRRRVFLGRTLAGLGAWARWPLTAPGMATAPMAVRGSENRDMPHDDYHAPDWLRSIRALYFDGYTAPLYPHMKDFDAKRLVEILVELGGDTLRFQPIGNRAYYPSKTFPMHPELGNRDLITEVSQECRKVGLHLYCYTGYGMPVTTTSLIPGYPECAEWVLRDPEGRPYGVWNEMGQEYSFYHCLTGDPYREAMRQVVRELCEHDTDAVYFDSPSDYRGICFCDSCRRNFNKYCGLDLDRLRNVRNLEHLPEDADMRALGSWYDWANKLTKKTCWISVRSFTAVERPCSATTGQLGDPGRFIHNTEFQTA